MRLKAVLFDAAGTLIRPAEPVGETYARLAREEGVDLPASRIEEAFRRILDAAPPMVFPGRTLACRAAPERDWWRDRVRETFRAADQSVRFRDFEACFGGLWDHFARGDAWRLAPGAVEGLRELDRAGFDLGIVSNFDQRLRRILKELGIADRFAAVVLPADALAAKPERLIFDVALKRLGLAAQQAAYVGDREEEDLRAASAAGLRAVDVASLATLADLPGRIAALGKETG